MKIIDRAIDELTDYERNAKIHPKNQIALLATSLEEYGWTQPILIDGNDVVVCGHGRLAAARKLGWTTVPTILLDNLTEQQIKAYRIADNKLAELGVWDEEMLAKELADLTDGFEFDLKLTGFDEKSLSRITAPPAEDTPAEEPKTEDITTTPGTLWHLGEHILMCGDATSYELTEFMTTETIPHVTIIDPPYDKPALYKRTIHPPDDGALLVVFWDLRRFAVAAAAALAADWKPRFELVWQTKQSILTNNAPLDRHRACGVFGEKLQWSQSAAVISDEVIHRAQRKSGRWSTGGDHYRPFTGGHTMRTVEEFPIADMPRVSKYQKPFPWIRALLAGLQAQSVFDPFAGSGVSLIAAESLGIPWMGIELDPASCDVIVQRWERRTGRRANSDFYEEFVPD